MSDAPREEPKPIPESFLRHVAGCTTSYSEAWREVCARLLWAEQRLAAAEAEQRLYKGDGSLECKVVGSRLAISIGINTLAFAFVNGPEGQRLQWDDEKGDWDPDRVKVPKVRLWAEEVVRAMTHEAEDGSSPLTRFIDKMVVAALDDGSEAVHIPHLGFVD